MSGGFKGQEEPIAKIQREKRAIPLKIAMLTTYQRANLPI